jgi:hypothetical protein
LIKFDSFVRSAADVIRKGLISVPVAFPDGKFSSANAVSGARARNNPARKAQMGRVVRGVPREIDFFDMIA